MQPVIIYTDGSSRGNPGPGGYGIVLKYGTQRKEISAGYRKTTNNRMELLAVIVALEALKKEGLECIVYSDSQYVINSVERKWVFNWIKTGFKGKKNADLWIRFLNVYKRQNVAFLWVKGHANNPENERCDTLAVAAAQSNNLLIDTEFENEY